MKPQDETGQDYEKEARDLLYLAKAQYVSVQFEAERQATEKKAIEPIADWLRQRDHAHSRPDYERNLLDLLAVIHRDGGHYTEEHGRERSIKGAVEKVVKMLADGDLLRELAEKAQAAVHDLESIGGGHPAGNPIAYQIAQKLRSVLEEVKKMREGK